MNRLFFCPLSTALGFPESMSASVVNLPPLQAGCVSALRSYELLPSAPMACYSNCLVLEKCFARCYSSFYLRGST